MRFFTGKKVANQQGFTLIELIVVIAILGVLVAVAVPGYSKFFGAGETEANLAERSNIQAAMDAMMAYNRLLQVTTQGGKGVATFDALPTSPGCSLPCTVETLYPSYLRIGNGDSTLGDIIPTKRCYTWDPSGFVTQHKTALPDPLTGACS